MQAEDDQRQKGESETGQVLERPRVPGAADRKGPGLSKGQDGKGPRLPGGEVEVLEDEGRIKGNGVIVIQNCNTEISEKKREPKRCWIEIEIDRKAIPFVIVMQLCITV